MRKIRTFYYILRQGVANSFKNWHMLFSSVFVIFVSLYIMGCLTLASTNLQRILGEISERLKEVEVFCSSEISDEASLSIADIIVNDSRVEAVERISKEENLQNVIEMLAKDNELFEYSNADFMFVSFRVKLRSADNVEAFAEDMKKVSGIEDVSDNLSVYEFFSSLSTWVRIGSVAALIVLGFLSIMLSANTIRLTVFARKKELQIMKNIGASRVYMRGPFVVEGVIIGLLSSLLSYFAVKGTYVYLYNSVNGSSSSLRNILNLSEFGQFSGMVLLCFLAAGILVGVLSSGLAIGKYVKV